MHVHTCTRTCTWVYTCTSTWVQVYTHVHQYLTKETLASNLKGKRQNVRHAKTNNNTLCTYSAHNTMHPLTTFQVRVRHKRQRTWSPRETTYLIASRDDVRDRPERRRTWSPRETTYAIAPRDDVQDSSRDDEAASERAWSPWSQWSQCHRVRAGVVKGSELSQTWRASWRLVIVTVVMIPPK